METYLIVDGYNVIHSWERLSKLAEKSLEEARNELVEIINNYNGYKGFETIVVFDAYNQKETQPKIEKKGCIEVVYTQKNQSADSYIEKLVHDLPRPYRVKVVTSDYTLQKMILANDGERISSRELELEIERATKKLGDKYISRQEAPSDTVNDVLAEELKKLIDD
jgi:predicted RNA-binding protein with PIN domain